MIKTFEINICKDCYDLKGECCNNTECVFYGELMKEVALYLDALLIRPKVDGIYLDLCPDNFWNIS